MAIPVSPLDDISGGVQNFPTLFRRFLDQLRLERDSGTPVHNAWLIREGPLVRTSTYLLALAFDGENLWLNPATIPRNMHSQLLESRPLLTKDQVLKELAGSLIGPIYEI